MPQIYIKMYLIPKSLIISKVLGFNSQNFHSLFRNPIILKSKNYSWQEHRLGSSILFLIIWYSGLLYMVKHFTQCIAYFYSVQK